jgi:hypothetical protein
MPGTLNSNKYLTPFRVVTGTPQLFPNDVVLLCDTSLAPVVINLLDIPVNYWSTQWKLYIVDFSNNASVNNITINAGTGQLVNGLASFVISTNGAYSKITIGGNAKFLSQNSTGTGGGGYNLIQDEGVPLPQQPIIDFVGAGVTATNGVGKTIVTIPGAFFIVTNAQLITLILAGTMVPGAFYLVTDVLNADEGVIVQGVKGAVKSPNTIQGSGLYLNADYQNNGDYSGVVGFTAWKGMWSPIVPFAVVIGDVVIYNNIHYKNISGIYSSGGGDPSTEPTDWVPLAKSTTTGYIRETDFVKYDVGNNLVRYRADVRLNEVDYFIDGKGNNSLVRFQWGRSLCKRNKLRGDSIFLTSQSNATIENNYFENSQLTDNTPNIEPGTISKNFAHASIVNLNNTRGLFDSNNLTSSRIEEGGQGIIDVNTTFVANSFKDGAYFTFDYIPSSTKIEYNSFITGGKLTYYVGGGFPSNCSVVRCLFSNNGILQIGGASGGINLGFYGCEISDEININFNNVTKQYINKKYRVGYSNWEYTLTASDMALGVLTIPIAEAYNGIFTLSGITSIVSSIVNLSANHRSKFIITPTETNQFLHTLIGVAVANNMVSDAGITNTLIGRIDGGDYIAYEKSGNLNQRVDIVVNA